MMRKITTCLLTMIAFGSTALAPARAEVLILKNATVVDVEAGTTRSGQTIRLDNGWIEAVGAAGGPATEKARVIDLAGKYVLPGLWDMHLHPDSESDLLQMIANGVTGGRIMWGKPEHLAWRAQIELGERRGPRLFISGPIIEGRPPPEMASVIATEGRRLLDTRAQAIAEVRAQKAAGYDYLKVYNNLPADAYAGLVEEGGRLGMPVVGHIPFEVGLDGALAARQKSIEHLRGYNIPLVPADARIQPGKDYRSRTLAWAYADLAKLAPLVDASRAAGVYETPTLSTRIYTAPVRVVENYLAQPAAAYLDPSDRASLKDRSRIKWLSNFSAADWEAASQGHAKQDAVLVALHRAGVPILAGTDLGPWGFTLHYELEQLVAAGLTPRDALMTATINAAQFAGIADRAGKVAPGYQGDLLILDADPLQDIHNTQRIAAVVTRGEWLGRTDLDAMLAEIRAKIAKKAGAQ
ncbi:amidohydrolase family protein [Sphingopyxis sp.]|uniref:amidohydrolase family protein n=1 Tax=Sphingopyxis sp. TaxID=1908224 RepID=UPI003D6C8E01